MNRIDQFDRGYAWVLGKLPTALAVVLSVWIIVYGLQGGVPRRQYANIVLAVCLGIYYFDRAEVLLADRGLHSNLDRLKVGLFVVVGIVSLLLGAYVHVEFWRWLEEGRMLVYTNLDLVVGAAIILIVVDATFRAFGNVLGLVVVTVLFYAYAGPYFPGILQHSGLGIEQIIRRQTIALTGVFGFLLQIGATWIAIFILFAGMVDEYGGFDYILDTGEIVAGRMKNGVPQIAVVSSMILGMMMGAAASNVATTGSFTIPLMKDRGIPSRVAGAIEATASTGGQILPPIMGLAAFIMADILTIPYATVAIAGVVPAILFYGSVALSIHLGMVKNDWSAGGEEVITVERRFIVRGLQYVLPLVVLTYTLMILEWDPMTAGLYTIGSIVVVRLLKNLIYDREPRTFVVTSVKGLATGSRNLAPFMAIVASLGMVIDIFSQTSLGQKIAINLVIFAGENALVILLVVMFVCLLLGLGMPTPAAYVLVATILAPVLTNLGISPLVSHFYVFYFALLSAITPPVALAVAIAIGISGSDFLETAKQTLVFGGPAFLIPFIFLRNPSIIHWEFPRTIIVVGFLLVATSALVVGIVGYNGARKLTVPERLLLGALALFTAFAPRFWLQIGGGGVTVLVLVLTSRVDVRSIMGRFSNQRAQR